MTAPKVTQMHTPGEWVIEDEDYLWSRDPDGGFLREKIARFFLVGEQVETPGGAHDYDFPETTANLRLCAAGPRMLEALQAIAAPGSVSGTSSFCEFCGRHAPLDSARQLAGPLEHRAGCIRVQVFAAIAAATGEQP